GPARPRRPTDTAARIDAILPSRLPEEPTGRQRTRSRRDKRSWPAPSLYGRAAGPVRPPAPTQDRSDVVRRAEAPNARLMRTGSGDPLYSTSLVIVICETFPFSSLRKSLPPTGVLATSNE